MKRRDSLKALSLSLAGLGMAVNPVEAAVPLPDANPLTTPKPVAAKIPGGRQAFEAERDARLMAETFFTPHELATVSVLSDIIIPADAKSGSATQAGVPAFIEFMMKDQPQNQTPMRGGLRWLDNKATARYGKPFKDCPKPQQIELVEQIAYPGKAKPDMTQGVAFFSLIRNYTITGFYTTKMGIDDIGYVGNVPNNWEGVPADVRAQYGV
jgi:gluconate 2-dehydrogenase gamma chain